MICSSSASGEVGLLYTPCAVRSFDGWAIQQATTSTKEQSVLKSREKQRGKSSDFGSRIALLAPAINMISVCWGVI